MNFAKTAKSAATTNIMKIDHISSPGTVIKLQNELMARPSRSSNKIFILLPPHCPKSEVQGELNIRGSEPHSMSFSRFVSHQHSRSIELEVDYPNSQLLYNERSMV